MTFVHTLPLDVLATLIRASGMMWLITKIDGKVLDASPEFLRWIGYTHDELLRKNWENLSVQGDDIESDINAISGLGQYDPFYVVRKQYIPNGERPVWGEPYITRSPATGAVIDFCLCYWIPIKDDFSVALETTMKEIESRMKRIDKLNDAVEKMMIQSDEDRFFLSVFSMIRKHPKTVLAGIVFTASIFGINNGVELLQRMGVIALPVQESPKTGDASVEGVNALVFGQFP